MFNKAGSLSKARLLKSTGRLYTTYYDIDGYQDYYYGSLLTNTSQIYLFGLEYYFDGLLLRIPTADDPSKLGAFIRQDKMFEIFKEHHHWQDIIGLRTVGDLNDAIDKGYSNQLIQISEALQGLRPKRQSHEVNRQGSLHPVMHHRLDCLVLCDYLFVSKEHLFFILYPKEIMTQEGAEA